MEIIRLSGYDIPEKVAIATRYLVPKALKEAGLQEASGQCIINKVSSDYQYYNLKQRKTKLTRITVEFSILDVKASALINTI